MTVRQALLSEARFTFRSNIDKHLFGNQDLALLEEPWPNATQGELLARLDLAVSHGRERLHPQGRPPRTGRTRSWSRCGPNASRSCPSRSPTTMGRIFKRPVGYEEDLKPLGVTDREPQFYSVAEVAHYSPVPECPGSFKGMSWLTPVLRDVAADQALTRTRPRTSAAARCPGWC